MSEIIDYLDREKLKISFSTLIIKVSSINKYFGELSEFAKEADLYGVTNGKLHLMAEMMEPPYGLYNLVDEYLLPLGMEEGRDYIFVTEQLVTAADGLGNELLNQPIPGLNHVDWLESLITKEGNYVWYKEAGDKKSNRKSHFSHISTMHGRTGKD